MKIVRNSRLLIFAWFVSVITVQADVFLDAVKTIPTPINEISDKKKSIRKSPLEFKQAIARYIKQTEISYFAKIVQKNDEKVAYKKELHYLFKNYGKLSAITLLSRIRSAHHLMMKENPSSENETYQQYERICSALLLVCVQVFFNEIRSQLLQALEEIDNLLFYWRYQQNHSLHYFFGKSPLKWVMGKKQSQEIVYNIMKLERKQKELYTILGSIIGHAHAFTEIEMSYENCYIWIEQLFERIICIKNDSYHDNDGSKFDEVSAELQARFKRVNRFKTDCLISVATAKKANHFVRHWLMYTALLAATAYSIHYHSKNPEVIGSAVNAVRNEAGKFLILLLHPLQKICERGKLVFEEDKKEDKSKGLIKNEGNINEETNIKAQWIELIKRIKPDEEIENISVSAQLQIIQDAVKKEKPEKGEYIEKSLKKIEDILNSKAIINEQEKVEHQIILNEVKTFIFDAQLMELIKKIKKVGDETEAAIAIELAKSNTSIREAGFKAIREALEKTDAQTKEKVEIALKKIQQTVKPIKIKIKDNSEPTKFKEVVKNKKEVDEYQAALSEVTTFVDDFSKSSWWVTASSRASWLDINLGMYLILLDDDYLNPLQKYTEIIDGKILPLFQFSAEVVENLGTQVDNLVKKANDLEAEATKQLKEASQQLKDHELTLMFTSLIPLGIIAAGTSKLYQWATKRNYSPIRIALAQVNSLLIEATDHLGDHDYGKLIYLIYQLRHKAAYLKDSLAQEFLSDVAKLESRQYTAPIKREMIQNMFNKYAFLGKIAT